MNKQWDTGMSIVEQLSIDVHYHRIDKFAEYFEIVRLIEKLKHGLLIGNVCSEDGLHISDGKLDQDLEHFMPVDGLYYPCDVIQIDVELIEVELLHMTDVVRDQLIDLVGVLNIVTVYPYYRYYVEE